MDEPEPLAERFEAQRGQLRTVAYRMPGSLSEAMMPSRRCGCAWAESTPVR